MGSLLRITALSLIVIFVVNFSIDYIEHNKMLTHLKSDSYKYIVNDSMNQGTLRLNGFEAEATNDMMEYLDQTELERAIVKNVSFNIAPVTNSFSYELYSQGNLLYLKLEVNGIESITKFSMEVSEYGSGT